MGITFDAGFIIDVIRGHKSALAKARELENRDEEQFLTTPALFEVTSGLLFARSRSETAAFRAYASQMPILPFDQAAALRAAEIRVELQRSGKTKGATDVMIAGIAAQGGHVVVTCDRDFLDIGKAAGVLVESY